MDSQKVVIERDYSKTWSGLPAPSGWYVQDVIHSHADGSVCGFLWERTYGERITVMEDVSIKDDGLRWLHVSVAKPNKKKRPTYDDIAEARRLFVGGLRECYQVFPTDERYVNANEVLHLWSCLDKPLGVLPHFEKLTTLEGKEVLAV